MSRKAVQVPFEGSAMYCNNIFLEHMWNPNPVTQLLIEEQALWIASYGRINCEVITGCTQPLTQCQLEIGSLWPYRLVQYG